MYVCKSWPSTGKTSPEAEVGAETCIERGPYYLHLHGRGTCTLCQVLTWLSDSNSASPGCHLILTILFPLLLILRPLLVTLIPWPPIYASPSTHPLQYIHPFIFFPSIHFKHVSPDRITAAFLSLRNATGIFGIKRTSAYTTCSGRIKKRKKKGNARAYLHTEEMCKTSASNPTHHLDLPVPRFTSQPASQPASELTLLPILGNSVNSFHDYSTANLVLRTVK